MANQAVKLCEALLRSISALDGTPCGLEGLAAAAAAAGPRQKQAFRKFYDLKEDFTDMDIVQKNTWKKLIIELKVFVQQQGPIRWNSKSCQTDQDAGLFCLSCKSCWH